MADLDYAEVRGRLAVTVGDTDVDPDLNPDVQWCDSGTVRFTPNLPFVHVLDPVEGYFMAGNAPIEAIVGPDGRLSYNGQPFVMLLDLGSTKVNPQIPRDISAYKVDFINISSQGRSVNFASFMFHPLPGEVNDLTLLAPLPTGTGTTIVRGPVGPQGEMGPIGDTGPQGPQGIQGIQGIQGEKGDTGDTGPQGIQGIQGIQGEIGPEGPQGIQGVEGPIGPVGITLRGDWSAAIDYARLDAVSYDGASWYASEDPPTGEVPSAVSAYWHYLSQRGEQGVQGIQGVQGPLGPVGPEGPQGIQGIQGEIGPEGPQGEPGTGSVDTVNGDAGPNVVLDAADVGARDLSWVPAWDDVTGKPTIFPPAAHTHVATTDLTATGTKSAATFLRGDDTWGVPPGVASGHTHNYSQITAGVDETLQEHFANYAFVEHEHSAADLTSGTIADERLPGRLKASAHTAANVADWNLATDNGIWYSDNNAANGPEAWWGVAHVMRVDNEVFQFWNRMGGGTKYVRFRNNTNVWGAWERTYETQTELDARYMNVGEDLAESQLPDRLAPATGAITDLNQFYVNGWAVGDNGSTINGPNDNSGSGTPYFFVTYTGDGGQGHQRVRYLLELDREFERVLNTGTWGAWTRVRKIYDGNVWGNLNVNATLSQWGSEVSTAVYGGNEKVATPVVTSGTVYCGVEAASVFTVTPTGNITLYPTNVQAAGRACTLTFIINQGATVRTVAVAFGVWLGNPPVQVANKKCVITAITVDGGASWLCSGVVEA